MKNIFSTLALRLTLVLAMLGVCDVVMAQDSQDEPIITFKTRIYENNGETNQFSLVIGSTEEGNYIDVDCGFGKVEYIAKYAAYDETTGSIGGTFIDCKVSKEGIVKIYGDASKIDYFNASGCYITEIDFPKCVNMDVLDLSHNELKSLDLSHMTKLSALYLSDNTFTAETPLKVGGNKPNLKIMELSIIDHMDESFNLSDYPALVSFDGYANLSLKSVDPSGCPYLLRLTLDVTPISSIDVSNNPSLMILNVSDTYVTSLDLSNNPYLTQLYCSHIGSFASGYKFTELDVTNNPELVHLFCGGNALTSIDISKNPKLVTLSATDNLLTSIDVSKNPELYIVELNKNCLDFATLPLDPGTWNTYYYNQKNMPVNKSYKVGETFDFSSRVLREGTETYGYLFTVSETSSETATLLDESYYTYADGKITINDIPEDSVYIAFANDAFPEMVLRTEKFKVKHADDFGLPTKALTFTTGVGAGSKMSFGIGVEGATETNPVEFWVNFGDGTKVPFTAKSNKVTENNVSGARGKSSTIEVYMPEGYAMTAAHFENVSMYNLDVTKSASLRSLHVVNAGIYNLDLSWNRCLEELVLTGNNLSSLTLEGAAPGYAKYMLTDIDLSNNGLSSVTLNDLKAIKSLNLSNNKLSDINFADADYIEYLNISNNKFTEVNVTYCSILKHLDVSHNSIDYIVLPTENNIEYFACNDNLFTIANLPRHGKIKEENFIYAPQADFTIATKGPGIDLSELNVTIDGKSTQYAWIDAAGNTLVDGTDYTNDNGRMVFKNTNVGTIYCAMSHPVYPAFAGEKVYKTTPITAAGMPTNVVASFKTSEACDSVSLSLAAEKAGTAIYFGWDGNENLTQYLLGDTYKVFNVDTKANTEVKVYTYEPTEKISVFSISGVKMSSCDVSNLTDAINITLDNAGLTEVKLPENSTKLQELSLGGNKLTTFDLSKFAALRTLNFDDNAFETLDITPCTNLEVFSASFNNLSSIKMNNPKLWALYLDHNKFETIDFAGVPNVSQLSISNNLLTSINVDGLSKLIALSVVGNKLTFATLPLAKSNYIVYYYSGQAPIAGEIKDGRIDLSSQKEVAGTPTTYRWFLGAASTNPDTGELEGEELIIDTEYTISEGVTQFLTGQASKVMCVMTNAQLPNVFIYTNLLTIDVTGIEEINANAEVAVSVKNNNVVVSSSAAGLPVNVVCTNGAVARKTETVEGETVIEGLQSGVYVVTVGTKVCKVLVK